MRSYTDKQIYGVSIESATIGYGDVNSNIPMLLRKGWVAP